MVNFRGARLHSTLTGAGYDGDMDKKPLISPLRSRSAALILLGLLQGSATSSAAAWDVPGTTSAATLTASTTDGLRAILENKEKSAIAGRINKDELVAYYTARNFAPLWVEGDGMTSRATQALAQIARAAEDGLVVANYQLDAVGKAADALRAQANANTRGTMELLISDAIYSYGRDLGYGATPRQNRMRIANLEHKANIGAILDSVAQSSDAGATLAALAPASSQYRALKTALVPYRQLAAQGGWPTLTPTNRTIRAGERHANIPAIRAVLARTGDLQTTAASTESNSEFADTLYDTVLQAAVAQFQARHGLAPDGTLGPVTQKTLAVPADARVGQIIASMERLRWLPDQLGERYIIVNVPSYTLGAYEHGKEALTMRVIVGSQTNATPIFSNQITDVTFNPSWGVPRRIAVKELLPKIRKDPTYLDRAGYKLTAGNDSVDPNDVDWESMTADNFDYGLRQKPGSGNALGKIKFGLPNNDDIYMHDTSKPQLFADADRAMSHGCVRLEKPRDFALFVMRGNEGWNDERVDSFYNSNESRTIRVTPVPVHLTYITAQVDESTGRMYFYRDVYGLDDKLIAALTRPSASTIQLAQK